jgi:hypothetical protein
VPFENTFFHLGVHNLPAGRARDIMRDLEAFTDHPGPGLSDMLDVLAADPATLIVFNHPYWDERGIRPAPRRSHLMISPEKAPRVAFYTDSFHEVNGASGVK